MYAKLSECEAVVVRTYERPDGTRFAKVIACGTTEEMEEEAITPKLLLTFPGCECVGDSVVPVSELLPPDEVTL
jgi:hypothetical protein